MKKEKLLFFLAYLMCVLFSTGAAFNEGLTRWYSGIPFFILFFVVIRFFKAPRKFSILAVLLIFSAIVMNISLPKNQLLYPILNEGYLLVKEDGFIHHYSDDSAGFYQQQDTGVSCTGCGETKIHPVQRGEKIKVEGIVYHYPNLGFQRSYKTKYGHITPRSDFELSHEVSPLLKLGELMYVLLAPLLLTTLF